MATRAVFSAFAVLIGLSIGAAVPAGAEPSPTTPVLTSTDDELVDMVLDAVEHDAAAPSTTPSPAPPG